LDKQVFTVTILSFFLTAGAVLGQDKPASVNVSISAFNFSIAPYVIAKEKNYLRQEGIEPRFILMHSAVSSQSPGEQRRRVRCFVLPHD
jgi:hypothetical protein